MDPFFEKNFCFALFGPFLGPKLTLLNFSQNLVEVLQKNEKTQKLSKSNSSGFSRKTHVPKMRKTSHSKIDSFDLFCKYFH